MCQRSSLNHGCVLREAWTSWSKTSLKYSIISHRKSCCILDRTTYSKAALYQLASSLRAYKSCVTGSRPGFQVCWSGSASLSPSAFHQKSSPTNNMNGGSHTTKSATNSESYSTDTRTTPSFTVTSGGGTRLSTMKWITWHSTHVIWTRTWSYVQNASWRLSTGDTTRLATTIGYHEVWPRPPHPIPNSALFSATTSSQEVMKLKLLIDHPANYTHIT